MIPPSLFELLEAGAKQEEALRARDIETAVRFGQVREHAWRRLQAEIESGLLTSGGDDAGLSEGDLVGSLREARAANLRSRRLARAIRREVRHEIDALELSLPAVVMAAAVPSERVRPAGSRYIDRRG